LVVSDDRKIIVYSDINITGTEFIKAGFNQFYKSCVGANKNGSMPLVALQKLRQGNLVNLLLTTEQG
jgi:hypothetical protein